MASASTYQFSDGSYAQLSAAPTNLLTTPLSGKTVVGTAAADQLRDVAGGAVLQGGLGDDSYYIGDYRTTVTEAAGAGVDTAYSFLTYTLTANIEDLVLLKSGITGTGNAANNLLMTKAAGTTLVGGAGNDVLVDLSTGATTFSFGTGSGKDVVYGFNAATGTGHDILKIDQAGTSNFVQMKSHLTQSGSDVLMTLNANDSVLLKNVTLSSLTA
ncbi:MAG: hypothetical protein ABIO37_01555, partial [Caulobacteraceae bacterium]